MSISKKIRFEVFKRDSFICQYCGKSAPDVILEVDHINPKSKGGEDDILNLVTSCQDCNRGKSDRKLSDDTVIKKRKEQLDQLQQRREQLDLLMEWHKSLLDIEEQTITELADFWNTFTPGYSINEVGITNLKNWVKKFSVNEIIEAIKISTSQYLKYSRTPDNTILLDKDSVEKAFNYIPKICYHSKQTQQKPYLKDLYYIRGILRNRFSINSTKDWQAIKIMEDAYNCGIPIEAIKNLAKDSNIRYWSNFKDTLLDWIENPPT